MRCHCRNGLSVIQGDTLDVIVDIKNPDEVEIEHVKFICKSLDIDEELQHIDEDDVNWGFTIDADETSKFRVGTFTFDVNAILSSGEVFTVLHNKPFRVIYKYNK